MTRPPPAPTAAVRPPRAVRPLRAVLDAVQEGAPTVASVVARTGLPRDVVEAAVDHLVRAGRLSAEDPATACPAASCGSCALRSLGSAGCGVGVLPTPFSGGLRLLTPRQPRGS